MAALLQLAGALQQRNEAKNQAIVDAKTTETDNLTEEYNLELRRKERIQQFRENQAYNIASGGSSGVDPFSGSAAHINTVSAGNLKSANYSDVFSTSIKRGQNTEASKARGRAAKSRATANLLNTGASIFSTASGKLPA